MSYESRVKKSLINARVNLIFYFLGLIIAFFSRKTFLSCLGVEYMGLTGTLFSILSLLNLTEFGISSAISVFLYKPLQSKNREKIIQLISLFGYFYRKIGYIVGGCAIIISIAFPFIFKNTNINSGIIYYTFYCYLTAQLIGYFINYRQILMTADQKNYIITVYMQTAGMIKTILQIILVYFYKDPFMWITLELLFNIFGCVLLNKKLDKEYPWLHSNVKNGKLYLKTYPEILSLTKKIFIHQIKDFILNKSDEILIFSFVSLKMVAYYGNYTIIVSKINQLIASVLNSVDAGVGQMVAENDKEKIIRVFWELMSVRYFIAGLMTFSLYILVGPFVTLWLGSEYLLSKSILILLLITVFITQTRGVVDIFNHAYGHYNDVWAAWVEGGINIGVTVVAASFIGIQGILLGKIISLIPIILIWKPYYLFTVGIKRNIRYYWSNTFRYYIIFAGSFAICDILSRTIVIVPTENFGNLILYAICTIVPFLITYFILLFFFAKGMKDFVFRMMPVRKNKA